MLHYSRWKTFGVVAIILLALAYALPNLFENSTLNKFPSFLPKDKMTLGLDLQGGSHFLIKVKQDDIIDDRIEVLRDDVRSLLREDRIGYTGLAGNGRHVRVKIRDEEDVAKAREKIQTLGEAISSAGIGSGSIKEVVVNEPVPGSFELELTDEGIAWRNSDAVSKIIQVLGRRINALGTTEPTIQRQGDDRILVQVPGADPELIKPYFTEQGKLQFRMVNTDVSVQDALQTRPPVGTEILYEEESDPPRPYVIEKRTIVSGEDLVDAQPGFDQRNSEPIVTFRFNNRGATAFGKVTQANIGRPFAIVLDDVVISAPVIQSAILGGTGQISGSFSIESASQLAILMRAGALPAGLTIIEERSVGPGLGADSIEAGKIAALIGAVLVVIFMLCAYGLLGVFANIALVINMVLIVAVLSVLGATLTLPGIAGIVLTMGMAVDANVLIFERIREEKRGGRSLLQAVEAGFKQALSTILDANITTIIAAAILFWLGSGPIKGFAVTLGIGILTSMFTAFVLTKLIMTLWLSMRRPKELPVRWMTFVPDGTKLKFMRLRKLLFPSSALAMIGSVALFVVIGLNYGIDFKGGTLIELQSKAESADVGDIRSRLGELNLGDVQVQEFGAANEVLVRVEAQGAGDNAEQTVVANVRAVLEEDYEFRRVEVVGPTVSGELARDGSIAVIVALFAVLVYIWFRFEWQFAVGAILALTHDVILTIGMFAIFQLEFSLSSLAAILTIVGYSLNDTVVVYDRIRENLRKYKKMSIPELLDKSINDTLSRTILTSVTTLVALFALYFFGGAVLSSFTFAMIFGVFVGTYSSIFIAAPLLILFKLRQGAMDKVDASPFANAEKQEVK